MQMHISISDNVILIQYLRFFQIEFLVMFELHQH